MRKAHAIDPSRIMTFTSGWAGKEWVEEDSKAHMMPYDSTLYMRGWYDNHRAGGPATWMEEYYKGPNDNLMYTSNRREIYMRGEEGAISTPPRLELINAKLSQTGMGRSVLEKPVQGVHQVLPRQGARRLLRHA